MKIIIIGTSLSGKTTLLQYLKSNTNLPLAEIDEELTKLNSGSYPTDQELKNNVLAPQIISNVLKKEEVVFFTNTDYFTKKDLKRAKAKGFKIIQLDLSHDDLKKRNKKRMVEQNYQDISKWLGGMAAYQEQIRNLGLVDHVLDGNQPTEKIAQELQTFLG